MAFDEALARRVRRLLGRRRDVAERRMMGGLAFMVDGAMCCSVGREDLLVRVGSAEREAALRMPGIAAATMGGRTMRGLVRVGPDGFRTEAALRRWIERGVAAGRAKPGPRSRR